VHVLSTVRVEDLPPLGTVDELEDIPEAPMVFEDTGEVAEPEPEPPPAPRAEVTAPEPALIPTAVAVLEPPAPAKRQVPMRSQGLPVLRDLEPEEVTELQRIMKCRGSKTLQVIYGDGPLFFKNVRSDCIPEKFLKMVDADD
jgi:hypothetical protein